MNSTQSNGRHRYVFRAATTAERLNPSPQGGTKALLAQMEALIAQYPVACVAAALVAGVTLGWFVKRR